MSAWRLQPTHAQDIRPGDVLLRAGVGRRVLAVSSLVRTRDVELWTSGPFIGPQPAFGSQQLILLVARTGDAARDGAGRYTGG